MKVVNRRKPKSFQFPKPCNLFVTREREGVFYSGQFQLWPTPLFYLGQVRLRPIFLFRDEAQRDGGPEEKKRANMGAGEEKKTRNFGREGGGVRERRGRRGGPGEQPNLGRTHENLEHTLHTTHPTRHTTPQHHNTTTPQQHQQPGVGGPGLFVQTQLEQGRQFCRWPKEKLAKSRRAVPLAKIGRNGLQHGLISLGQKAGQKWCGPKVVWARSRLGQKSTGPKVDGPKVVIVTRVTPETVEGTKEDCSSKFVGELSTVSCAFEGSNSVDLPQIFLCESKERLLHIFGPENFTAPRYRTWTTPLTVIAATRSCREARRAQSGARRALYTVSENVLLPARWCCVRSTACLRAFARIRCGRGP